MSKLWDDLKKNVLQWSSAAVEKAEEMSKIAVAKTEELTRISKIKIEIHQLQRDRDKAFEELGRYAVTCSKSKKVDFSGDETFVGIVKRVTELEKAVKEKEAVIEKIKKEYDLKEEEIESALDKASEGKEPAAPADTPTAGAPEPQAEK